MRKLALVSALLLSAGAATVTTAEARPGGRGYSNHGGYAYGGPGYNRGYNRGGRGIGTGAAVGLGIAGLAAGAVAAGAARDAYYRDGYDGYRGRRGYGAYDYGY